MISPRKENVIEVLNTHLRNSMQIMKSYGVELSKEVIVDLLAVSFLFADTSIYSRPKKYSKKLLSISEAWLSKYNATLLPKFRDALSFYAHFALLDKPCLLTLNIPCPESNPLTQSFHNCLVAFCELLAVPHLREKYAYSETLNIDQAAFLNISEYVFPELRKELINLVDDIRKLFKLQNKIIYPFLYMHFIYTDTRATLNKIGDICQNSNILVRAIYSIVLLAIMFAVAFVVNCFIAK